MTTKDSSNGSATAGMEDTGIHSKQSVKITTQTRKQEQIQQLNVKEKLIKINIKFGGEKGKEKKIILKIIN